MADQVNLADPDCEPTDEQLIDLSKRAFAHVANSRAQALERLQEEIERQRAVALERFGARIARAVGREAK